MPDKEEIKTKRKSKEKFQVVEVACPKCQNTEIIRIPNDEIPKCLKCKVRMVIKEILTEGKSY